MIVLKIVAGVAAYLVVCACIARFCGATAIMEEIAKENEQR
jgi:hypothetical protein